MAVSTSHGISTVPEFRIKLDGTDLPRTAVVLAVHVSKIMNKISYAKLILQDGNSATGMFPLSDGPTLVPGAEVEIAVGPVNQQERVFKGIVIKHSLKIRSSSAPELIIECRHKAVKMTVGRKSASFYDMPDSDVIGGLVQNSGLSSAEMDIEATSITHKELIQYNSSNWDYMLTRSEVNGQIVLTNDDKVVVKKPVVSGTPSLTLEFGRTILELDAEIDARKQYAAVKASTWDMADQAILEQEASDPNVQEQGDLSASEIADVIGLETLELKHAGAIGSEEAKAWADAQLLKSRMSKIRGRIKVEGVSGINPGDLIELKRIGNRFNGNAFVSGVRQDYDLVNGWKTQIQFGGEPNWFAEEAEHMVAPKAGGTLPGVIGLHTGVVVDNEDPAGEFRVRVKIPFINPQDEGVWARMALADAGADRGLYFRPEINDEVVIGFLYDDPRQPIVLGMLHSSNLSSPLSPTNDNHLKGYTSREGIKMIFDDEKKSVQIETPGGNKALISDDAKGIQLIDQNGNKIVMDDQGIKIESAMKLEIKAGTQLVIGGANVQISADGSMELKGGGSTKLESSGILTVKGSLVQIN